VIKGIALPLPVSAQVCRDNTQGKKETFAEAVDGLLSPAAFHTNPLEPYTSTRQHIRGFVHTRLVLHCFYCFVLVLTAPL